MSNRDLDDQIKASISAAVWCSQIDRETGEPGLGIETKTSVEWGNLWYGITPELEQSGSGVAATLGSRFSVLRGGVQLVEFWLQVCQCLSQCDKTVKDLVPQLLWWEEGVVLPKLLRKGRSHPPPPTPKFRVLIRKREEMLSGQRPTTVYFIWSTANHLKQTKLNDHFSLKEGVQLSAAKWLGVYMNLYFMGILAKVRSGYEQKEYLKLLPACLLSLVVQTWLLQQRHSELEQEAFIQWAWVKVGKVSWINLLCGGGSSAIFFSVKRCNRWSALQVLRGWGGETHDVHRNSV